MLLPRVLVLKSVMTNEVVLGLQIAEQAANASATADRNGTATASEGSGRASADFEEAVLQNSAEFYRSASSSSLRLPCAAGRLAKHSVTLLPRKRSVHPPRADDHSRGESFRCQVAFRAGSYQNKRDGGEIPGTRWRPAGPPGCLPGPAGQGGCRLTGVAALFIPFVRG